MDNIFSNLAAALSKSGFVGEIEQDSALRAAMSTDNSVYEIVPDLIVAPWNAADVVRLLSVLYQKEYAAVAVTARGGGTGTNGQSLNRGVIIDTRRHLNRLLAVDSSARWAEVEPGIVLDDLNDQLRDYGLFFAPETSTSTRCTIGGMVSTDASGKGSRVYGKTSDNMIGIEIATRHGLLASFEKSPAWAVPILTLAERATRQGRAAFIRNTPRLNRRFTGYDLERAITEEDAFEWWRLFPGSEGTLGPITRVRVKLRPREAEKRLIVAAFATFRQALASTAMLLCEEPTAVEVMDERIQQLAEEAGILGGLPGELRQKEKRLAYVFVEFNGDDCDVLEGRLSSCKARLMEAPGLDVLYTAKDLAEIKQLWAIRSAGVGLLGKISGRARPVAFVEDCVVPPEHLPAFVDDFLAILRGYGLDFGMYGHADVGCIHIRPALNIDSGADREKLIAVSDAVFALTKKYGGIFWGEHGKGLRGAYLAKWIGPQAYTAFQGIKAAFDPAGRFNPGKLVSQKGDIMGIATTNFRAFNSPSDDKLEKAFRCNGNAQCLSYAATTPMCPSFKASADVRHSPKGRADALRAWRMYRSGSRTAADEKDLLGVLDTCLGCKACATKCPVQVDIPRMRTVFYEDYYDRNPRPLADSLTLLAERLSPLLLKSAGAVKPIWPFVRRVAELLMAAEDLPDLVAQTLAAEFRVKISQLEKMSLPENAVLVWQDWFTALFDGDVQADTLAGLSALGYKPFFVEMRPAGKAALNLGEMHGFGKMAARLRDNLTCAARTGAPMIGLDPAFVLMLRQDYGKEGYDVPEILLPQEFLVRELSNGKRFPRVSSETTAKLLTHCTEITGAPAAGEQWAKILRAIGVELKTPELGCCGMAGLFGHLKRHQQVSRRLFERSWQRQVESGMEFVLATGFSCRCQAERLAHREIRHPLWLVAKLLK